MNNSYVTVVGGINADIIGTPTNRPIMHDSNPGTNTLYPGGVGRNIAENIARLGIKVKLLSAVGDDFFGQFILKISEEAGIDVSDVLIAKDNETSTYVCVNDEKGDMHYAVNDMNIMDVITPEYLRSKIDIINNGAALVIDTNITADTIKYITDNVTVPIFADTVSENKASKLVPFMDKLYAIKVNLLEAELLSGRRIDNFYDAKDAACEIQNKGVQNVYLTMGSNGVVYCGDLEMGILPNYKSKIVNSTGCGDSFIAATVYGFVNGYSAKKCAKAGLAAASICIGTKKTVSDQVSPENINKIIEEDYV